MTVKQAAATFVPFAAAPGRVELVVGAKGHEKQTLTAWSDDATVKFEANTPTPWLKVTPVTKGGKAGARKFAIEVTPADLKPGVHQGSIEVTAPGAVNEPIQIPVVVTVPEKSK